MSSIIERKPGLPVFQHVRNREDQRNTKSRRHGSELLDGPAIDGYMDKVEGVRDRADLKRRWAQFPIAEIGGANAPDIGCWDGSPSSELAPRFA